MIIIITIIVMIIIIIIIIIIGGGGGHSVIMFSQNYKNLDCPQVLLVMLSNLSELVNLKFSLE